MPFSSALISAIHISLSNHSSHATLHLHTPHCAALIHVDFLSVQIPIGLEDAHEGVVDLVERRSILFGGYKGMEVGGGCGWYLTKRLALLTLI
jgi:hypothetical protein